ncbi:hypothetical protein [Haloferula sp. A504]|uniref:hypothetical protein n=1 Tax=Haloferula sp. A504 TaxID=3373601 RepID=UPI0031C65603|nr:hypothetical protein [Verrucomicrobiaceae bacterium E54]
MIRHPKWLMCPPAARRARHEPARLGLGNANLWADMREVLLDPEPDSKELEVIRRWLREEVERELLERLRRGNASGLVRWACRLSPRLIWKLPFSRAQPSPRHHRRIVAVLLPHKLRQVEQQLAVYAFREGLT